MRRCLTWAAIVSASAVVYLTSPTLGAVDKDRAVYIGGTLSNFPEGAGRPGGGLVLNERFNVEGRINTHAESHFVFDTGTRGAITIPFVAEIRKATLDVDVSDAVEDATVSLNFRVSRSIGANVAMGAIYVRQDRPRLVSEFAESGRSEETLAARFARTFVEAYRRDNARDRRETAR